MNLGPQGMMTPSYEGMGNEDRGNPFLSATGQLDPMSGQMKVVQEEMTIPDDVREQIISMSATGMQVDEIIEMGIPQEMVQKVLIDSKVQGRNPKQAMEPMPFNLPSNPRQPSSPPDDEAGALQSGIGLSPMPFEKY
jgi:hypothetical protein